MTKQRYTAPTFDIATKLIFGVAPILNGVNLLKMGATHCVISRTLFWENLRRFWPLSLAAALTYLFSLSEVLLAANQDPIWRMIAMLNIIIGQNFLPTAVVIASAFFTVFLLFRQFFNMRHAEASLTWPVTKTQVFCTNVLSGLVLCIVPIVVFGAMCLSPVAFVDVPDPLPFGAWHRQLPVALGGPLAAGDIVNTPAIVGGLLLRMIVMLVFYKGLFLLLMSAVGGRLAGMALCGVVLIVPTAAPAFINGIVMTYVFGFSTTGGWVSFLNIIEAMHPPFAFIHAIVSNTLPSMSLSVLLPIYAACSALFFGAAFVANRRRMIERVGTGVVFYPVWRGIVYAVAIICGFVAALIGWNQSRAPGSFYIGLGIGVLLAVAVVAVAVWRVASWRAVFWNIRRHLAVFAATLAVIVLAFSLAVRQYSTRLPPTADIQGVFVSTTTTVATVHTPMPHLFTKDPGIIQDARALHQSLLDDSRRLNSEPWRNMRGSMFAANIQVIYLMEDGRMIPRRYEVDDIFLLGNEHVRATLSNPDVVMLSHPPLRNPSLIEHVRIAEQTHHGHGMVTRRELAVITDPAEIHAIAEILTRDVLETHRTRFTGSDWGVAGGTDPDSVDWYVEDGLPFANLEISIISQQGVTWMRTMSWWLDMGSKVADEVLGVVLGAGS